VQTFWSAGCILERSRAGQVAQVLITNGKDVKLNLSKTQLTKVISDAVSAALSLKSSRRQQTTEKSTDRNSNIRAAIRSGRSKSAVRRQYRLTDYEYRGHKATVTRMANGN
tara:strand:+ start:1530 stop:1862 length:333 start_codon:yes stop_codon:yes gene_type:complete